MDPLEKELLMRDVERYGYHLAMPKSDDPGNVLSRMLTSDDGRVLEGVPVVLTNMLVNEQQVDLEETEMALSSAFQRRFRMLAAVTYLFLFWVPDSDSARKELYNYLNKREPALLDSVKDKLRDQGKLNVGGRVTLDAQRLENTYRSYVVEQLKDTQASFTKKIEEGREAVFKDAVAELFTKKQAELLFKVLDNKSMTKTEREYYSRVVKPRLKALRNPDLQSVAATLLGF